MPDQFDYENVDFDALIEYAEEHNIDLESLSEEELAEMACKMPKKESSKKGAKEALSAYKNKSMIQAMEGFEGLFEGETLTEEFKDKAKTIFEAAVVMRVQEIENSVQQKFQEEFEQKSEEIMEEIVDKLDGYLDLMVEKWFEKNQIALESGMRMEILESFVGGLKSLFTEHNIEVPEEKVDLYDALEEKVESLQSQLTESVEHRIALKTEIEQLKKLNVVNDAVKGLTDLDAERLKALAEDVVYESEGSFAKKLEVIKESFFANTKPVGSVKAVVTDSPVIEEEVKPSSEKTDLSESVQHFVKALDLLSIK